MSAEDVGLLEDASRKHIALSDDSHDIDDERLLSNVPQDRHEVDLEHVRIETTSNAEGICVDSRIENLQVKQQQNESEQLDTLAVQVTEALSNWRRWHAWELINQFSSSWVTEPESLADELKRKGVDVHKLQEDSIRLNHALAFQHPAPDWVQVLAGEKGLTLHYKHQSGSSVHGFCAEANLHAPVEHPLAMLREFDLIPSWLKYIEKTVILEEFSDSDLIVYCEVWAPWPMDSLSVIVRATADEVLQQHGFFFINAASVDEGKLSPAARSRLPSSAAKTHRFHLTDESYLKFWPLLPARPGGPSVCRVEVVTMVEAGMKHVPQFLITFVLKVFAPFIFNTAVKILDKSFANPDNVLPRRMVTRKEVYDFIKQRVATHLASQA